MAIYKRGDVWWMDFRFEGKHVQKSTKLKNKRDAESYERAFRTQLAKGDVGLEKKANPPTFDQAIAASLMSRGGVTPSRCAFTLATMNCKTVFPCLRAVWATVISLSAKRSPRSL